MLFGHFFQNKMINNNCYHYRVFIMKIHYGRGVKLANLIVLSPCTWCNTDIETCGLTIACGIGLRKQTVPTPSFEGKHCHSSRREEVLWNRGLRGTLV